MKKKIGEALFFVGLKKESRDKFIMEKGKVNSNEQFVESGSFCVTFIDRGTVYSLHSVAAWTMVSTILL